MQRIKITQDDRSLVKNAGKLTFRTLRGSKFRCNQLPSLGKLSRREVDIIRKNIYPRHRLASHYTFNQTMKRLHSQEPRPLIRTVQNDGWGGVDCPYCNAFLGLRSVGIYTCSWCDKEYKVIS